MVLRLCCRYGYCKKTMLKISQLSHTYSGGEIIRFPELEIQEGQAVCLIGPSGKGKSTLLHLVAGLLTISKGEVVVVGVKMSGLSDKERNKIRAEKISVIMQETQFVSHVSFEENIALALKPTGVVNLEFARKLAKEMGVDHLLKKRPEHFSGGERQRAAIVIAMAKKPSVLLADEPTANLDDDNAAKVANQLLEIIKEYKTALLVVTHDSRLKKHFETIVSL